MTALSIQNIAMDFGERRLFENVAFSVNEGDFAGLVGANGTGKTTLFKIIIGEYQPSEGMAVISKNTKLGYLEQHACQGSERNVLDELLTVFGDLISEEIEMSRLSHLLEQKNSDYDELIAEFSTLSEHFNQNGGLTYKSRAKSALLGLGFKESDFNLPVSALSGGQKSKLSMAKLLLSGADFLLLDEPTNHLDIAGVEWLENFLLTCKKSGLIISHDRYFLDKVTNKTVEIANNKCYTANGGYSVYREQKQKRLETERHHYETQLAEIKRIEGIIARQRQFARERNFITAESKRKMLEKKKAELVEPERPVEEIRIKFETNCETGNDVLFVKGLSKSFGEKKLFENGDMQVYKGDRAFILGKNGCGKTTLLKILTKKIYADRGSFTFGANVKVGYFDQSLEALRGGKTVIDEIWDEHRSFTETVVRNYLALFLFKGDDVYKNVDSLSGGEKAKLCLLKLMLSGANVLLLDEPTNHLDITSREILENALCGFDGTIIAVSHDRYFINKLANKIYRCSPNGFELFDGNYDDYCALALNEETEKPKNEAKKPNQYKLRKERDSEINRLKGKISREEKQIEELDLKVDELNSLMSSPEVASDFARVIELTNELEKANAELSAAMEEWEKDSETLAELSQTTIC